MSAPEVRGRAKFLLIAGLMLLPEWLIADLSVTSVVRGLLTSALLFATWIGHGWARALLILSILGGDVLCVYVAVDLVEHSRLALLSVAIVSYGVVGMTLLFSRDVRAYLKLEKLPPGPSRGDER
jgi:hypothetical protein